MEYQTQARGSQTYRIHGIHEPVGYRREDSRLSYRPGESSYQDTGGSRINL